MEPRCFSFGPFVLIPERQLLLKEGSPVRVGSRALEILTVLVERHGELLNKQEIISLVWTDTFVDESNLKVNIAAIRKAIDPSDSKLSCIVTVIGRGYRFVEPVKVVDMDAQIGQSEYSAYAARSSKSLTPSVALLHRGAWSNCGTSSGRAHFWRLHVKISTFGANHSSRRSRVPSCTKTMPEPSFSLLLTILEPQLIQ